MSARPPDAAPASAPASAAPPPWIIGVDFSGAARAGSKIWIAQARPDERALTLAALMPASALPGGGEERGAALAALVAWLAAHPGCPVGLDFPFGLHRTLVSEPDLRTFIAGFQARFPHAEAFRAACAAAGRERELRRRCDHETRTPFAPHNRRLFRQTWHGIAEVLAPLCAAGARLLPQEAPRPDAPSLLETCPASALKARGWYAPYKGRDGSRAAARTALVANLAAAGVRIPTDLTGLLVENSEGDALDAVLCAWIAWRAVRGGAPRPALAPEHAVEGYVYA